MGYRRRSVRPALALWALVLFFLTAAVGSVTVLLWAAVAVVTSALLAVMIVRRHRPAPVPVPTRRRSR